MREKLIIDKEKYSKKVGLFISFIFLIFIVIIGFTCVFDNKTSKPIRIYPSNDEIIAVSETIVSNYLKAPSTAEYPIESVKIIGNNRDSFFVSGYVDAQNSFGAKLRNVWVCLLKYNKGDFLDDSSYIIREVTINGKDVYIDK